MVLFLCKESEVLIIKNVEFKTWIKAAGIRAVKTVAQTAVATIGTSAAMGEVNWILVASSSVLAGIVSLLTSVTGLPELDSGTKEIGTADKEQ